PAIELLTKRAAQVRHRGAEHKAGVVQRQLRLRRRHEAAVEKRVSFRHRYLSPRFFFGSSFFGASSVVCLTVHVLSPWPRLTTSMRYVPEVLGTKLTNASLLRWSSLATSAPSES